MKVCVRTYIFERPHPFPDTLTLCCGLKRKAWCCVATGLALHSILRGEVSTISIFLNMLFAFGERALVLRSCGVQSTPPWHLRMEKNLFSSVPLFQSSLVRHYRKPCSSVACVQSGRLVSVRDQCFCRSRNR